jgi:hypothetical protein
VPNLPIYQTKDPTLQQLQTVWKSQLTPAIQSPIIQGHQIDGIKLINGATTFNHLLGRQMAGWFVVDTNANVGPFRSQPLNDKTLTLTATGMAILSVWVY